MDNKITKRRLSDFFAYEWFAIVIAIALFILAWEGLYALAEVKPTVGQKFIYFYDQNITAEGKAELHSLTADCLSYDVLQIRAEELDPLNNVLDKRLEIREGDVIITDSANDVEDDKLTRGNNVRARLVADSFGAYSLDKLLEDAKSYLKNSFFRDEYKGQELGAQEYTADKIDQAKLRKVFLDRMKNDNRYRTDAQKQEGIANERARIEQLCKEVCDFGKFMEYAKTQSPELLYRYTIYDQALKIAKNAKDTNNVKKIENYLDNVKKYHPELINAPYGINLGALKGGKSPSEFFTTKNAETAENVVLMVFDFRPYQPHLQYETISFINTIIRECSDILN